MSPTSTGTMPVAIVGMSCKFAGDATGPEKLWEMLAEGRNAWSEIPASRFNQDGVYNEHPERLSTSHVRGGHFLKEDIGLFDAAFFNFSAETAATLDPQFRLQLESVYEALENAGIPLNKIAGSKTSVFAGAFFHDYNDSILRDADNIPRFYLTGLGSAMASNRISHFFDLRGPSMTVDTGCSTTLTALHQAVQSLRAGDADMSIVGGSNVMLNPDMFKTMSSLGLLSADGRSFAFDDRANGYGRGEGVATVVLKPLVTAVRDGDTIRAVIRETGLNQDGKTETITSPSQRAQEELIRACYQRAGLDPANTQYFEAHGTGTPTGDPIEARAVAGVFSKGRRHGDRLRIGSVKTNIGHTEPTSGLASVIKVALALEKSLIPPSVNFEQPNRKIDLAEWNLEIPTTLQPWPAGTDGVRRASVNNFGYGGSNAHVIMESYHAGGSRNGADSLSNGHASATNLNGAVNSDHVTNGHDLDAMVNGNANGDTIANGQTKAQTSNHVNGHDSALVLTNGSSKRNVHSEDTPSAFPFRVLLLTAKDEQACQTLATNFAAYLEAKAPSSSSAESVLLDNLVHTLSYRRTVHPWVTTHQFTTLATLVESLRVPRPTRVWSPPRLGMVFTGQGAQWYAMGRELIHAYPVFRASITEAERYLTEFGADYSLMNELLKDADTSRVNETRMSTPLTVSVQISLVRLLRSWGVVPNAVTSHSSGEIAAAYAVGALSYRSAMAVSYFRSGLAGDIGRYVNRKGGMLAVGLGADAAEAYLKRLRNGQVVVACINSPSSITASGDIEGIQELEALVKQDGIFARRVMIDAAYHSHHVEPISKPYLAFLEDMRLGQEDGPELLDETVYYSSPTTGGRMTSVKAIANPQHWVNSMIQPVLFLDSLQDMLTGAETDLVLEVGAHAALSGPVNEVIGLPEFREQGITYASCLVRKQSAVDTMHALVGTLLRKGCPVDLTAVNFPRGIPATVEVLRDLPSYPWNHRIRHWFEPRVNREYRQRKEPPHELLGTVMAGSNPAMPTWRNFVRPSELGWVREHVVQSHMVFPGAGYICMAIEAIRQLNHPASKEIKGYHLKDVDILQALIVPDAPEGIEVQTALRPVSRKDIGSLGWMEFSVSSVTAESQWTEHARGLVSSQVDASQQPSASPVPASYSRRIQPEDIWIGMRSVGIYHGPVFQNIKSIRGGKNRSLTAFSVASTPDGDSFVVHPTTLDSVFQATYTALPGAGGTTLESPKIPRKIKRLWISSSITRQAGHNLLAYTSLTHSNSQSFRASVSLRADNVATPVLELDGLVCQSLGSVPTPPASNAPDRVCAFVEWAPDITFLSKDLLKQQLSFPVDTVETETLTDLRRACIYYMSDALGTLSEQDVARLAEHHRKFHAWMHLQVQLARNGELGLGSEKWLWPEDASVRNEFLEEVEKASINGKMVCHLGPHFVAMLRGEAAPLELMMQDKLLYRYYAEGLKWDRSTHQMAELLRHLVHKNPRARILEVGAGTGGATRHVLKVLGSNSGNGLQAAQYDFTDVSAGFFEEAKKVFAEWEDVLRFRKLDIEVDPSRQGFETGAYDIVIACQVLHATRSMENTMTNVRKLLKPGGKLLMTETTRDQLDLQFVFGLLPGWWLSKEPERNLSPSLTLPFWDRVLDQTGFSGLEFEVHDCESERLYSFSTIMSTAVPSNQPPDAPVSAAEIVIVTGSSSSSPTSRKWLELLQEHISSTTHMPRPDTASLESLLQQGTARGKICVFVGEVDQPILSRLNEAQLQALQALATSCKGLLWLTRGGTLECTRPTMGLAPGFLRSLRHEYVGRDYVLLDLDPGKPSWAVESISCVGEILAEHFTSTNTLQSPGEFEYAERDGVILVPRIHKDHVRNQTVARMSSASTDLSGPTAEESFHQDNRPLQMVVGIPGQLNTLIFRDMAPSKAEADLSPEYIEVKPRAFGVNFRDVMAAMGQLDEQTMGIECSGVVTSVGTTAGSNGFSVGDRVMCTMRGDYASRVRLPWTSATQMPPDMSFELAASVPMAFLTAYISLYNIANLRAGRSVLIHAAAGGVGQAAIALAKHVGAEVFVTAGTEEKREFLEQEHGIPRSHIFSSRDVSFAPALLAATDGRGVDVVLNSLAGQLLQESFNCLAPFGHFVEIGKRDIENNHNLEMQTFARTATFSSVDLLDFAQHRGAELHRALVDIVQLIARNKVQPISPVTTYPLAEIEKAFRLLQAGKHMGKVVLSASEADTVPAGPRVPKVRLRPDASYLVVGGLGGIGRSIAQWMVDHGAKHLILLSRSGVTEKTAAFISELEQSGCAIRAISCDVADGSDLGDALVETTKDWPGIRGVIQGAMVLQDSVLEKMTISNWNAAIWPKVQGSWNLHHQLLHSDLDFFVMLSSLAGVVGYASQSNYAAGGSFQDALATHRVRQGLPGVAIDLGMVKSVGYVAETGGVSERMTKVGHVALTEEQVLAIIGSAILNPSASHAQLLAGLNTTAGTIWENSPLARDLRFADLPVASAIDSTTTTKATRSDHLLAGKLTAASSLDEVESLIISEVAKKLADIFMLSEGDIVPNKGPADYGVDSLVAVEIRNMLAIQAGADISIFHIMQSPSLRALAKTVAEKSVYIDACLREEMIGN